MVQITSKKRVSLQVRHLRARFDVDTQYIRKKTIGSLEEIFRVASDYALGRVTRVTDETGARRILTMVERQFWARIAGYAAQLINNIAKGIDERQIDLDLTELERMLNENKAKSKIKAIAEEAERKVTTDSPG